MSAEFDPDDASRSHASPPVVSSHDPEDFWVTVPVPAVAETAREPDKAAGIEPVSPKLESARNTRVAVTDTVLAAAVMNGLTLHL